MKFPNLARYVDPQNPIIDQEVDKIILQELSIAKIPVLTLGKPALVYSEVPFTHIGLLGNQKTVAELAQVKKFLEWTPDNKFSSEFVFHRCWYYWSVRGYVPLKAAEEIYENPYGRHSVRAGGDCGATHPREQVMCHYVCGMEVVPAYHIDDQEGLNLFVEVLRRHKLVKE
jgi:hypothetical protein